MGIRDITLLASRAVLGGYLAAHGAQKLFGTFGGHGIRPTAAGFDRLGLRPGRVTAAVAGVSEFGGGLLTVAGLASPAEPVAIAGTLAVASTTHRANGPFAATGDTSSLRRTSPPRSPWPSQARDATRSTA
jgi:putative oxidoreductase